MSSRDRIIDAAIELFASHGFHETSMRDIASAVGIKVSSIYSHFAGKDEILTTILDLYKTELQRVRIPDEALDELVAKYTPAQLLCRGLMRIDEFASFGRSEKILLIILNEVYRTPAVRTFGIEWLRPQNYEHVKRLFAALQRAGKIRHLDLDYLSFVYNAMINSHVQSLAVLKAAGLPIEEQHQAAQSYIELFAKDLHVDPGDPS